MGSSVTWKHQPCLLSEALSILPRESTALLSDMSLVGRGQSPLLESGPTATVTAVRLPSFAQREGVKSRAGPQGQLDPFIGAVSFFPNVHEALLPCHPVFEGGTVGDYTEPIHNSSCIDLFI